jgi:2-oxoglutarate ferredoxin oxidoreductase subunit alpha
VVDRLLQKHKSAARFVPAPEIRKREGAQFGVVTIGGCTGAVNEALEILHSQGVTADFMRIRGFPFHEDVEAFLCEHEFCFIVEQNRDAQLRSLLLLETPAAKDQLRSILVYGGFPLSARHVIEQISLQLEKPECLLSQSQS